MIQIKFGVYFDENLGTLYKENSITTLGKRAKVTLDLNDVIRINVNFMVNGTPYKTSVSILNRDSGLVSIPFKSSVLKEGTHTMELVAIMKNGDVIPSSTYTYTVDKSLEDDDALETDTNYPIIEEINLQVYNLEQKFNQLIISAGNSNAEIVDARIKSDGTSYSKLSDRLNAVDSQLEHNTHHINNILINDNCADLRLDKDLKQNEDITLKLQNLLNNQSVDKVILPKGYYIISDTIIIPNGKEVVLQGNDIDKNIYSTMSNLERDNFTIIKASITNKALFDVRKFAKVSGGYIDFSNCENSVCFLIDAGNYECHQACLGSSIIRSSRGKGNIGVKFNLDNTTNSSTHSSMENTINLIILNFDTAYLFYRKNRWG